MNSVAAQNSLAVRDMVSRVLAESRVTDIHTHIYDPGFGEILLWGMDDLLVFHYLVAETMRWLDIPYETFWRMSKREQADLVWKTLFVDRSPVSEACRGVLTTLAALGLDPSSRNLDEHRAFFAGWKVEDYVDHVFRIANLDCAIMTNDPFDDLERPSWLAGKKRDPRFRAALRIDALLNSWDTACPELRSWGYQVHEDLGPKTYAEVRRFLTEWARRMDALYMAASLPPAFTVPEDSPRGRLVEECILPVCHEAGLPFGMMIGVKKLVNPGLRLAGDSVGRANIDVVEYLCSQYPDNKFLVTMLSRENQHELCVAARKFRNLMIFGCWWFVNTPSIIEEMTRMRVELLGLSFVPQHSDARVLDQVIYKWIHSRAIIGDVLAEKYADVQSAGWTVTEDDVRRDVAALLGGNFWKFIGMTSDECTMTNEES